MNVEDIVIAPAPRAEIRDRFLRVHFGGPSHDTADFHYFWLRHNCDCCRHPLTRERTICSSSIALELQPLSVTLQPDARSIEVVWNESGGIHRSVYALQWLREHAYALNRSELPPPSGDLSLLEVVSDQIPSGKLADVCFDYLQRRGAVVVRGAGGDTEALIEAFVATGLQVIETHFGRIEDLRTDNTTNRNTDQLGYTDARVDLHTDQPFLDEPPRYQLLHCMQPATAGGENRIVDAAQAAVYLRSVDRGAFNMLATVPVRFHRRQKAFERVHDSPIIELRRGGEFFRVRSSYFTVAPHRIPFEQMEQWYRAYNNFTEIVMDARHQYRFTLQGGDFVMYDNYRMLHARTGFSGPRWLRGVYFN